MLPAGVLAKLSCLTPKSVSKRIGTKDWNFYSFTPVMLAELLALGRDVTAAFMSLTDAERVHRGTKSKETKQSDKSGFENSVIETEVAPATVQHIQVQAATRKAAAQELYDAIIGVKNRNFIVRAVMDSLREDFTTRPSDEDVAEFAARLDLGALIEFVTGAMEANALVLRPFLQKAGAKLKQSAEAFVLDRLARAVGSRSDTPASTTPEPSSSDSSSESSETPAADSPGPTPATLIS
jgi:hypothetical protein